MEVLEAALERGRLMTYTSPSETRLVGWGQHLTPPQCPIGIYPGLPRTCDLRSWLACKWCRGHASKACTQQYSVQHRQQEVPHPLQTSHHPPLPTQLTCRPLTSPPLTCRPLNCRPLNCRPLTQNSSPAPAGWHADGVVTVLFKQRTPAENAASLVNTAPPSPLGCRPLPCHPLPCRPLPCRPPTCRPLTQNSSPAPAGGHADGVVAVLPEVRVHAAAGHDPRVLLRLEALGPLRVVGLAPLQHAAREGRDQGAPAVRDDGV